MSFSERALSPAGTQLFVIDRSRGRHRASADLVPGGVYLALGLCDEHAPGINPWDVDDAAAVPVAKIDFLVRLQALSSEPGMPGRARSPCRRSSAACWRSGPRAAVYDDLARRLHDVCARRALRPPAGSTYPPAGRGSTAGRTWHPQPCRRRWWRRCCCRSSST